MEELIEKLKELLEVEELDLTQKFENMEEWDSLTSLSIIALMDSDYGINMSHNDILSYTSIGEFCNYVIKNGK